MQKRITWFTLAFVVTTLACSFNLAGSGARPSTSRPATAAPLTPMPPTPAGAPSGTPAAQTTAAVPNLRAVFGAPVTFGTHADFQSYGFVVGPSDGQFGAIPAGNGSYTFYGVAGSSATCPGTPNARDSVYTFMGTLDHVSGSNCTKLFGPGDGPAGWVFDKNYAGGGQVIRFASAGRSGWLMPFHGEVWWDNPANADHTCNNLPVVACFYSALGLAVSTDNARTFKVVGQIMQPAQALQDFMGKGMDMSVGYGSLIVADAHGQHLDNPPPDPGRAFFYLFFTDFLAGAPGACATAPCLGVARAPYANVAAAALSGDPQQVATVFHKFDRAAPDPWTQPATSDTPDESKAAGAFAPLWTDDSPISPAVIYDSLFNAYLAAYHTSKGIEVRASSDLIHWSEPLGAPYAEPGQKLYTTTLIGEAGDPLTGGAAPRLYFSTFPSASFPNWKFAVLESVPVELSRGK